MVNIILILTAITLVIFLIAAFMAFAEIKQRKAEIARLSHLKDLTESKLVHFVKISIDTSRGIQPTYLKGNPISRFIMPDIDLNKARG
ncbi:hypothetical protein [Pedobacter gandavensis]|uniref:hypothetical protein n=1 Tax=Pedobacter gandavensis TaxID=2679963 RepID=UPI00292CD00B|nr:hypothetical protein [Pedobacter gandavensis]